VGRSTPAGQRHVSWPQPWVGLRTSGVTPGVVQLYRAVGRPSWGIIDEVGRGVALVLEHGPNAPHKALGEDEGRHRGEIRMREWTIGKDAICSSITMHDGFKSFTLPSHAPVTGQVMHDLNKVPRHTCPLRPL
jgi:hypothetical protein